MKTIQTMGNEILTKTTELYEFQGTMACVDEGNREFFAQ